MSNAYRDCGKKAPWIRDSLWRYEKLRELMCIFLMSLVPPTGVQNNLTIYKNEYVTPCNRDLLI